MTSGPDFSHSEYPDPFQPRRRRLDEFSFGRARPSDRPVTSPPTVPNVDPVDIAVVDRHLAALAVKRANYYSLDERRQFRTMLDALLDLRLDLDARASVTPPPSAFEIEANLAAQVDQIHLTDEG